VPPVIAVFIQHTDSKPVQQRLICPPQESPAQGAEACRAPLMLIHDIGLTRESAPRAFTYQR
jgi:hypothetical protein